MMNPRTHHRRTLLALIGVLLAAMAFSAETAHAQRGRLQRGTPPGMPPGMQPLPTIHGSAFAFNHLSRSGAFPAVQVIGPVTSQGLGYSTQSGVQFSLELHWQPSYGYVPILIRAASAHAAKRDRTITIRMQTGIWNSTHGVAVNETFLLPAGAASVEASLLIPLYTDWEGMTWEVFIDGRLDEELSAADVQIPTPPGSSGNIMVLTTAENAQRFGYEQTLRNLIGDGNMGFNAIPADELPTDWIGYTSIDVMVLPLEEFIALLDDHPRQAAALLRWVRTGGNLWIEELGADWDRLAELEQAIGLPDAQGEVESAAAGAEDSDESQEDASAEPRRDRGWRWPTVEDQMPPLADSVVELLSDKELPQVDSPAPGQLIRRQSPANSPPPPSKALAVRRYGMGMIGVFEQSLVEVDLGLRRGAALQRELSHSMIKPRLAWASRHGNTPEQSNYDFNNFLIPGVGLAPVGQFQFLITLFVIGIGPLNYWLLKRKNKLPMLLVTVPAAAVAVTALLFGYGILADGFNTRVRARSITLLDQQTQEATSWARLSYYAGIAPRNGLVMPADAAIYPIVPRWDRRFYSRGGVPRELRWTADQQDLTRGWLASRTPTQYLQIAARPSTKRLDLRVTDAGLAVRNRLGVAVTHLAVEDRAGRVYWCEGLAPDERKTLPAVDRNTAAGAIRRLFTDNLPEFPSDYDAQSPGISYYSPMPEQGLSQNIMEAELGAINSAMIDTWGAGSYIAFTKTGIETSLGVAGAEEEASFHVIRGTW